MHNFDTPTNRILAVDQHYSLAQKGGSTKEIASSFAGMSWSQDEKNKSDVTIRYTNNLPDMLSEN